MGPTPFYGARAEKPPKKADFAMKQTNICHLSGDIITCHVLIGESCMEIKTEADSNDITDDKPTIGMLHT